jgi:hypothetical protein
MALLVTGAAPLVAVGGYLQMKLMLSLGGSSDKLYSTANQAVAEAVASIRVIQVCVSCRSDGGRVALPVRGHAMWRTAHVVPLNSAEWWLPRCGGCGGSAG